MDIVADGSVPYARESPLCRKSFLQLETRGKFKQYGRGSLWNFAYEVPTLERTWGSFV